MELTESELDVLCNADVMRTKMIVSEKLSKSLELLQQRLKTKYEQLSEGHTLLNYLNVSPKVSRGENYDSLPYFVLDYPRYFTKENVCAIRIIVMWGSFFSVTFQVSGDIKKNIEKYILEKITTSTDFQDLSICVSESPWEHHLREDNYLKIRDLKNSEIKNIILEKSFIKLSYHFSIHQIVQLEELTLKHVDKFISLLK